MGADNKENVTFQRDSGERSLPWKERKRYFGKRLYEKRNMNSGR